MKVKVVVAIAALLLSACTTAPQRTEAVSEVPPREASASLAPGIRPVQRLQEAANLIATLPKRTLVVFDIDDTLLTTPILPNDKHQFFGSDRWYLWQTDKSLPDMAKGDDAVPCVYDVIAMNYEVGTQVPTERAGPGIVQSIPFDKLILTSRSPDYRDATERELKRANYPVLPQIGGPATGVGFTASNGTFVTYLNGVYMTRGGNKGVMLLELLQSKMIDREDAYDNVVLVDDSQNKLLDMQAALAPRSITFYGLRYEGIKPYPVPPVTADELAEGRASWRQWLQFLEAMYPERRKRFEEECKPKPMP